MKLYSFSLRRPVTVLIAVFAILVFAFISVDRLNTNLLPNISYPSITVGVIYENADPDTVESVVTVELERLLRSVVGVKDVKSTSTENASICQVDFDWGTDLTIAEQNMRSILERLKLSVPDEVGDPIMVKFDTSMIPILMLTVGSSGDIGDVTQQLYETVKPSIESIPGVSGVSIIGAADKVINVIYDQDSLNEAGLTSSLLQQYISYQNLSIPAGSITEDGVRYNIKVGTKLQTTEDIENLVIGMNYNDPGQSGLLGIGLMMKPLTIGDIATVEETYAEQEGITRVGGKPAISLSIYGQSDASPVTVSKDIKNKLETLKVSNPDLEIGVVFDQADFISKSIGDIIQNALFGAIFAVIVIFLFLKNFKSTLIIAVSLPFSILVTVVGMMAFNQTLNLMTLGGLALGIGMIVDNSIVVLDSIYRRLEYGDDPYHAALNGAKEVAGAIFASTMTTLVIFVPLIFTKGFVSEIFTSLAVTVILALLASLLVALTIIPLMSSRILKNKDVKVKQRKEVLADGTVIEGTPNKIYRKSLGWALKNPLGILGAVVALLIVAALLLPSIGFGLLPKMDMGRIDVNFSLPTGTSLTVTDEVTKVIEDKIFALDDIENIATTIGSGDSSDITSLVSGAASNNGSFAIMVKDNHKLTLDELGEEIRQIIKGTANEYPEIDDISCTVNVTGLGKVTSGDSFDIFSTGVTFEVYGKEIETLMDVAAQIEEKLDSEEMFVDVINKAKFSQPVLRLEVNRARALLGGLTVGQIGLGVRNSVIGIEATNIERNGESIPVIIKPQMAENTTLDDLLALPISASLDGIVAGGGSLSSLMGGSDSAIGGSSDPIILERVVSPQEEEGSFNITRKNGVRYATVSATYVNTTQSQANKKALDIVSDIELPEGYTIQLGGSSDLMSDAFSDLTLVGILAILFVYMVMAIQYESFLDPLIIMITLPLAVIGAIIFIKVWGLELGITAIIGLIMLIGIVVNNAILMVDYINQIRATGVKLKEAVMIASEARVRPVLMTALTTIAGLIPMVLGIGKGSELQTPMGVIVSGGMIFSTFLTLFVIPTLYLVVHNFVDRFKRKEV